MKIKNIAYLGIAGLCISSLTGCIEETVPMSDMVVEEQVHLEISLESKPKTPQSESSSYLWTG